jgi:acyl carrier protein
MVNNTTTTTYGSEIENKLREYISNHFLTQFGGEINDETDLFLSGIIDSFGFIELVAFIEKTFEIHLKNEDLMADKLSSIATLAIQMSA